MLLKKELRVVLQRLSEKEIEESRKSTGRVLVDTEDLEANLIDNDEHGKILLPKKIGKRHHCPKSKCKFSSVSRKTVVEHIRIHTGEKPYVCNYEHCGAAFIRENHLTGHSNIHKLKPFQCKNCPCRYVRREDLEFHINRKHANSEKPFKCTLCGNVYSCFTNLKYHMTSHTGQKNFGCRICWESFNWRHQLKTHEDTVHFGKDRQRYKCSICKSSYFKKSALKTHLAQKHGNGIPKKYNCEFCDKFFLGLNVLSIHMRTHTGEKPFQCKLCPFKSSQNGNLQTHIKRIHTKDKPYKCVGCSKSFPYQSELDFHSKIHTGEKPHTCAQCQKTFGYKMTLKSHMRTHTGEKPYTCTFCNKNFRHSRGLLYHTRTHTKEIIPGFECSECESNFMDSRGLKNHMMIHTGEKPFTCKFCAKIFRHQSNCHRHEKSHGVI